MAPYDIAVFFDYHGSHLEASVNRDADASIIVFDKTLADTSIQRAVDGVSYIRSAPAVSLSFPSFFHCLFRIQNLPAKKPQGFEKRETKQNLTY